MSFELSAWCFVLAVAAHNLEEALWLPAWSRRAGRWHAAVGPFEFRFAVAVLTALALVAALAALGRDAGALATQALCGYAAAMLANVFVPHLVACAVLRRYAPGTLTAVLLNLPAALLLLAAALREQRIAPAALAWAALAVTAGLLGLIPLLFWLGRHLNRALAPAAGRRRKVGP